MANTKNNSSNNNRSSAKRKQSSIAVGKNWFFYAKIFIVVVIAYWFAHFISYQTLPVTQSPNPTPTPPAPVIITTASSSAQITSQIATLQAQVQEYRDENYQVAIHSADDAGQKADRVVNYALALATIIGLIIALVTYFFGDMRATKNKLDQYLHYANKSVEKIKEMSAEAIEEAEKVSKQAQKMDKQFEKVEQQVASISIAEEQSTKSQEEIKIVEQNIKQMRQENMGTITSADALQRSAYSVSQMASGIFSPTNFGSLGMTGPYKKCARCGKDFLEDFSYPYKNYHPAYCQECNKPKNK